MNQRGWHDLAELCGALQGIAFLGPALCMIACAVLTPDPAGITQSLTASIVALLSTSFALGAWSRAGLYCNHQDLSPKVRFLCSFTHSQSVVRPCPGCPAAVIHHFEEFSVWLATVEERRDCGCAACSMLAPSLASATHLVQFLVSLE